MASGQTGSKGLNKAALGWHFFWVKQLVLEAGGVEIVKENEKSYFSRVKNLIISLCH